MADDIRIHPADGTWVVRADGAVIGESRQALELTEPGHPAVIYFPRDDIAMALLDRTATSSVCSRKGTASHFTIVGESGPLPDAAWSYESPAEGLEAIAGHLAFHTDRATVERL